MSGEIASLFVKLALDAKEFTAGIKSAGDTVKKQSTAWDTIGSKASVAFVGAGAAAGAFAVNSVQEFAGFQQKMNEVFTLLPGISKEAMGKMTSDVEAFSAETGKLPDDVIPAVYQALSAGVPQDNVFEFLRTANQAAVGGVTSLEDSVNGLSSAVNAYGPDVLSAQSASDTFFTTIRLGKTTFPELSAAMSNVAPAAAALKIPLTDVSAALATMTSQGEPTASASTKIRGAILELAKSGSAADLAFQKVAGKTFPEFIASGGTLQDALGLLKKGADESGQGIQNSFGSVEAGMAAVMLTSETGAKTFDSNMDQMADSAGATGKAFDTMSGGIKQQADKMVAAVKVGVLKVGDFLSKSGLGPIVTAFGPTLGRAIGAAVGGIGGFIVPRLTKVISSSLSKAAGAIGEKAVAPLAKGLSSGLTTAMTNVMGKLASNAAIGSTFEKLGGVMGGKMGTAIKGAVTLALVGIAIDEFGKLQAVVKANAEAAKGLDTKTTDYLASLPSKEEVQAKIDALKALPAGLDPLKRALFETGGLGGVFGADPKAAWQKQIDGLQAYLDGTAAPQIGEAAQGVADAGAAGVVEGTFKIGDAFDKYVEKWEDGSAAVRVAGQQLAVFDPDSGLWRADDDILKASGDTADAVEVWIEKQNGVWEEAKGDVGASLDELRATVTDKLSAIQDAFDLGVDTKKKKNVSGAERLKQMAKDIDEITKNLHDSIAANDPVNTAYWESALGTATSKYSAAQQSINVDSAQITADLTTMGVDASTVFTGLGKDAKKGKNKVNKAAKDVNFKPAADAVSAAADDMHDSFVEAGNSAGKVPPAIRSYVPFVQTAADALANAATNPMSSVPADLYDYGEHGGSQFVAGLKDGGSGLGSVANHWANLLEKKLGFSEPPPEGPLHDLPNWGPHMIDAWIRPMLRHGMTRVPAAAKKLADYFRSLGSDERHRNGIGDPAIADWLGPRHHRPRHRWDVADNPDLGRDRSDSSGGDTYIFNVGTLIANDAGIDELQRRMEKRLRRRTRGGRRLVGAF